MSMAEINYITAYLDQKYPREQPWTEEKEKRFQELRSLLGITKPEREQPTELAHILDLKKF